MPRLLFLFGSSLGLAIAPQVCVLRAFSGEHRFVSAVSILVFGFPADFVLAFASFAVVVVFFKFSLGFRLSEFVVFVLVFANF